MRGSLYYFMFLLLVSLFLCISCEKSNDTRGENLLIENEEVWLNPNGKVSVKIVSGHPEYHVSSSNKDILETSIEGDQIILQAANIQGEAEAIVYIVDSKQTRAQIKVFVSSYTPLSLHKESLEIEQVQALDSIEIIGGQMPFSAETDQPNLLGLTFVDNKLYMRAKRRGQTTVTIKDRRGATAQLNVQVGGQTQALNFADNIFAHTNFNAIAVVDQSIRNLKQVTFEMTCRIQGYRGLQTFMGLEGNLIVRGKNDDFRDTHPIQIAGLGDRIMLESTSSFDLNEWMHMALVVDCDQEEISKKYKLFINGQEDPLIVQRSEETHANVDLTRSDDGNRFAIGRAFGQDWRVIRGAVSEARIWTIARTAQQIQSNICALTEDAPQNLLAHWDFSSAVSTDYIQDINGGKYESNLILSDAKKNGAYDSIIVQKNLFSDITCTF